MKLHLLLPALLPTCMFGCGTPAGIATANFLQSPVNQQIIQVAAQAGAASIISSTGNKLTADQKTALTTAAAAVLTGVGSGAAWAAGDALRTKQGTPQAAQAGVLAATITNQSGAPASVSQPVATAVTDIAKSGVPVDVANEAVATTVQSIAAQKSPDAKAVVPPKMAFQNSGYSRSYGTWADWQKYLNASNAVWMAVK